MCDLTPVDCAVIHAAPELGLRCSRQNKQWNGPCPLCHSNRSLSLTIERGRRLWHCNRKPSKRTPACTQDALMAELSHQAARMRHRGRQARTTAAGHTRRRGSDRARHHLKRGHPQTAPAHARQRPDSTGSRGETRLLTVDFLRRGGESRPGQTVKCPETRTEPQVSVCPETRTTERSVSVQKLGHNRRSERVRA